MNDGITELAMLLKQRDNPKGFEVSIATVIQSRPLQLKLSDKIFLGKEYNNLIVSSTLYTNAPEINDSIIVLPMQNGSLWYAIDKAVI